MGVSGQWRVLLFPFSFYFLSLIREKMALIDLENQFKLKHYSTRQRLPNSPLLSLSMCYASSQENGPSEEVRV